MNHSKHQVDWFSVSCITAIISVCVATFLGFLFILSSGLVEEPKVKVEVISTTAEPAISASNDLPTDEVVGKIVASATNNEPVDINFSVRLRLADGETNKNK